MKPLTIGAPPRASRTMGARRGRSNSHGGGDVLDEDHARRRLAHRPDFEHQRAQVNTSSQSWWALAPRPWLDASQAAGCERVHD